MRAQIAARQDAGPRAETGFGAPPRPPLQLTANLPDEVEATIDSSSPERVARMLRGVTGLYCQQSGRLGSDGRRLIDHIMLRLAGVAEEAERRDTSRVVATIEPAPEETVRFFAHDVIAVAGPVLRHALCLTDADLTEIASEETEGHRLAIAARTRLSVSVTDVLVKRGEIAVQQRVALNQRAALSPVSLDRLAFAASMDDRVKQSLIRRADLPDAMRDVLGPGDEEALDEHAIEFMLDDAVIDQKSLNDRLGMAAHAPLDLRHAQSLVLNLFQRRLINEAFVAEQALREDIPVVVCALAALARVKPRTVERVALGPHVAPLLALCRGLDFSLATVELLVRLNHQARYLLGRQQQVMSAYRRMDHDAAKKLIGVLKSLKAGDA